MAMTTTPCEATEPQMCEYMFRDPANPCEKNITGHLLFWVGAFLRGAFLWAGMVM